MLELLKKGNKVLWLKQTSSVLGINEKNHIN